VDSEYALVTYQPYVTSTEEEVRISATDRNAVEDVPASVSHADLTYDVKLNG
jgi:hypothetical protein